jgi:segregation and condensation protein B
MSLAPTLECILVVAGEPLALPDIARALNCLEIEAESTIDELKSNLEDRGSGLQLVQIAGGYQLATRPEHAESVGKLLARGAPKPSRAAVETAAIIAYRQPITQPEIEAVRGVGCGSVLNTLEERALIAEVGRKQTVGRPILYGTTRDFLHYFGITDLSQLPSLESTDSGSLPFATGAGSNGANPLPAESDFAVISAPAGSDDTAE